MILYIIIGLIILGLIVILFEWVKEHWPIVVAIIAIVLAFVFGGLAWGFSAIGILALIILIREAVKRVNEKKLNTYLENNCTKMGYVSFNDYRLIASGYADKLYKTSFAEIVRNFVNSCERKYIKSSHDWISSVKERIDKAGMADMLELSHIHIEKFEYTHGTPNVCLIADALRDCCVTQNNPKGEYQLVKLQKETVEAELKKEGIAYSCEYLNAYKVADDLKMLQGANFESEELSLDDL